MWYDLIKKNPLMLTYCKISALVNFVIFCNKIHHIKLHKTHEVSSQTW